MPTCPPDTLPLPFFRDLTGNLISANPARESFRLFRAYRKDAISKLANRPDSGTDLFEWAETSVTDKVVVVQGARALRRFWPQGEWTDMDIMVGFDEDQVRILDRDKILLLGPPDDSSSGGCVSSAFTSGRSRIINEQEVLVRGGAKTRLTGLVSCANTTALTGSGTLFSTELKTGDVVWFAGGQSAVVSSVASNTAATLRAIPGASIVSVHADKGRDMIRQPFPASLLFMRQSGTSITTSGRAAVLTNPGEITHAGLNLDIVPGSNYVVSYDYSPLFVVRTDLGVRRTMGISSVAATLVISDGRAL